MSGRPAPAAPVTSADPDSSLIAVDPASLLPDGIAPPLAALLAATSFLTSAVTATFGLGGGVILLAVLLTVMPPVMAIPVHAVLQAGSNASRAWLMRRDILREVFLWFLPGSLVGVALGSLVVVELPTRWLTLALALFILWSVWAPKPSPRALPPRRFVLIGALGSFLTMFLGATGPVLAAFLSPARYGRLATVATHGACMMVQHLMKIAAFVLLGFSLADWLFQVALMLGAGVLGSLVGRAVLHRLPEALFRHGFRAVMTALALRMIWRVAFPVG